MPAKARSAGERSIARGSRGGRRKAASATRKSGSSHPAPGLVHDLNNLLSVAIGHATLALEGLALTHPSRTLIATSRNATQTAAALLRLLQAPPAQRSGAAETFDANAAVLELIDWLNHLLGDAIRLQSDITSRTLPVRADRAQLLSALLNLALNARQAMPDGGTLLIRTAARGRQAAIELIDSGHGIVPAASAKGRSAASRKAGGRGWGLRQVDAFARKSGGSFAISGRPGVGATAALYLPLRRGASI